MQRSPEEILLRCSCILGNDQVKKLVTLSSSPTAAFDLIIAATGSNDLAKAGRWLAILKRDHPKKYQETMAQLTPRQ